MQPGDEVLGRLHADPPRIAASDPKYVRHVRRDGARYHVLSWTTKGTRCSEKDCIVNKDHCY